MRAPFGQNLPEGVSKLKKDRFDQDTSFEEVEDVASFTECTGLVPALPLNDPAADEDLARLYAIHAPKKRNGIRCEGKEKRQRS